MAYLILGLVLFLGVHSVRIVADDWRTHAVARIGAKRWKGLYSLASIAGFALIVWGFSLTRTQPVQLWTPPLALRHLALLLTLVSFVLMVAAYVPGNAIKARLHHPMALAVKVWALAHLLSNGNAAHVLMFGAFLLWSVFSFVAARRRDRVGALVYAPGKLAPTLLTVVVGAIAWAVFAIWLHGLWIGVRPLG